MTPPFAPLPLVPASRNLNTVLLERLYSLPFDAFTRCVGLLLARMGYTNVCPVGRGHYRGSNQHRKHSSGEGEARIPRSLAGNHHSSGYDLVADLPVPEGTKIRRFAVASLKQFPPDAPARVFQRQVDEVRGTSLRAGASVALLITTGSISPTVAHRENLPLAPIAPVCVIDGEELARLCIRFGVGILPAEDERTAEVSEVPPVLDALFFERLARTATGNGPTDFTATGQGSRNTGDQERNVSARITNDPAVEPSVLLSVRVSVSNGRGGRNR